MIHATELWAVELDVTKEAMMQGISDEEHWAIHSEEDDYGCVYLCVYRSEAEAREEAKGRDHKSRVVRFVRATEKDEE